MDQKRERAHGHLGHGPMVRRRRRNVRAPFIWGSIVGPGATYAPAGPHNLLVGLYPFTRSNPSRWGNAAEHLHVRGGDGAPHHLGGRPWGERHDDAAALGDVLRERCSADLPFLRLFLQDQAPKMS